MHPVVKKTVSGVAALAALGLGGAALADAASQGGSTTTPPSAAIPGQPSAPYGDHHFGRRWHDEDALSAATAAKVKQAVTAKLPGATVLHADQLPDGGYVAVVRKSDGTFARVLLDTSFAVTSVDTGPGPRGLGPRGGPDGHRGDCPNMGAGTRGSGAPPATPQQQDTGVSAPAPGLQI